VPPLSEIYDDGPQAHAIVEGEETPCPDVAMPADLEVFLGRLSLEITAKHVDKLPLLQARLKRGMQIFIALIDPADAHAQIEAAGAVRRAGFEPVPHLPARFIKDKDDLFSRVARLSGHGVTEILVLGGGAPEPLGVYDAAVQLIETGVFESHGIRRLGLAGHPEGNPDIVRKHGPGMLLEALKQKQASAKSRGLDAFIATQFLFEAEPVAQWASGLRREGILLPIRVGVPGPATIKTLAKYALMCGVGNSARLIRRQALNISKLLTVSTPDDFVEDLARIAADDQDLGILAPHFYPFGGFDKLFDWLTPKLAAAAERKVVSFSR
jgi:methylenetetrahydrofolate reductase (NADH)